MCNLTVSPEEHAKILATDPGELPRLDWPGRAGARASGLSNIPKDQLDIAEELGRRPESLYLSFYEDDRVYANLPDVRFPLATAILAPIPPTSSKIRFATKEEYMPAGEPQ